MTDIIGIIVAIVLAIALAAVYIWDEMREREYRQWLCAHRYPTYPDDTGDPHL